MEHPFNPTYCYPCICNICLFENIDLFSWVIIYGYGRVKRLISSRFVSLIVAYLEEDLLSCSIYQEVQQCIHVGFKNFFFLCGSCHFLVLLMDASLVCFPYA